MLAAVFTSCQDDDDTNFKPANTVRTDVSSVTMFDSPFTANFSTSNTNVDEITIDGGEVADLKVAISDQAGSASFSSSDLGAGWAIGQSTDFSVTIDFGSSQSVSYFSIDVVEAMMAVASEGTIAEYDSIKSVIELSGETMFNGLGDIVIEKKVITVDTPNPDYAIIVSESAGTSYAYKDSVCGVDYSLNDTIVYKITATSGSYSESDTIAIPVTYKMLPSVSEGMLSTTESTFAFVPAPEAEEGEVQAEDVGVLSFVSPRGVSSEDVMFVKIEEAFDSYSELVNAVEGASLVSEMSDLSIGDIYAFQYTYEGDVYYGYMEVTEVTSTDIGDAENAITFDYTSDKMY